MTDSVMPLAPLPRGRHNLSRDEVEVSQRLRLAVGMAEACAESGFVNTSVKSVLDRAGVSRLTFYELYDDKLHCFLEALDLVGEVLVTQLTDTITRTSGTPLERAHAAVGRYLDGLTADLAFARLFIIEAHAAGPSALTRRAELQGRLVDALAALLELESPEGHFACEAFVAAASALVTLPVATADVAAVGALRDPLSTRLESLYSEHSRGGRAAAG